MKKIQPVKLINNVFRVQTNKGDWVDYQLTEPHEHLVRTGYLGDRSKATRLINKGRQAGFSTFMGIEAVVLAHAFPGSSQYYVATNEDQAADWLRKHVQEIAQHAKKNKNGQEIVKYNKKDSKRLVKKFDIPITNDKGEVIRHETSRVEGLPASSSGIRGKTALNVLLDEFDHVDQKKQQKEEIYNAVKDYTNQGGQMTIQTTPKNRQGMFWTDYTEAKKGLNMMDWFCFPIIENWEDIDLDIPFYVDIENDHDKFVKKFFENEDKFTVDNDNKIARRHDLEIPYPWIELRSLEEDRRKSISDFKQEKLGVPTKGDNRFISESLYDRQVIYKHNNRLDALNNNRYYRLEASLDVAQVKDFSSLTIGMASRKHGNKVIDEVCIETSQDPYPEQEEWIERMFNKWNFDIIHIDNTGVGRSLADYIEGNRNIRCRVHRVQGQGKIEIKNEDGEKEKIKVQEYMSETFKRSLQQDKYRLIDHEEARKHVLGVIKSETSAGYLKYSGKQSSQDRDDHFWSKAQLIADWKSGKMPRFSTFKNNTTSTRQSRQTKKRNTNSGVVTW